MAVQAIVLGIEEDALHVAVAEAVDLRRRAVLADQRVVLRYAAVTVQTHDLAQVVGRVLRLFTPVETVAQGQHQGLVGEKGDAPTVMRGAGLERLGCEQHFEVVQFVIHQAGTRQTRVVGLQRAVRVGQIQPAVVAVVRVQRHFHQPGLSSDEDLGQARHRLGIDTAVGFDDA